MMVMNTMVKKNGKNITKQKKQEEDIQKFQTSQTPSPPVVLSIVFFGFCLFWDFFPHLTVTKSPVQRSRKS